jgi:5-methylcytosine-specific restriction endonuclease McrBC GTP-binding regulatory subunit McrB
MYEARYNEQIYLTVIDEANIARVEYYFAELLSILEMPSRDNWIVDICPSGWDSDPKFVEKGRFKLPENMWFICTINNDDSTFAISDKVYDRAMPININSKGIPFDVAPEDRNPDKICISYKHLEDMFHQAQAKYVVSEENIKKFNDMDDYVIEHFRLAFGNRIVKQLKEFVPVYVACGGTEIDGLDYVLCNKILRKFESLNLAYIRDEIDGYIQYLSDHFGEENMQESKEYLNRLKKLF